MTQKPAKSKAKAKPGTSRRETGAKPARSRRKTGKPKDLLPVGLASETAEKVTLLLLTLRSRGAVRRACIDRFEMSETAADEAIDEAARYITLAADYHRDHELGTAIERLNECYKNSHALHDFKTCLAAQKELCRLLRLYEPATAGQESGTADTELAEIRGHLEPLELGPPDLPIGDLVRLAVDRLLPHLDE